MSEHRVPMLGTSWRRFEDPVRSRDPRIRSLVAALATLPAPAPSPEFRAELRAQLVAIAPRIVAESGEPTTVLPKVAPAAEPVAEPAHRRPRHTDSVFARLRTIPLARPLRIATAVVTVFALLLGGAVYLSRKALPGDTLYGLKRASEQVQLDFAGSNTAKAQDLLDFASERTDEVQGLLARAGVSGGGAGGINAGTAQLIASTLASADSDVRSASDLLTTQAVQNRSTSPLTVLTRWAPGQISRLQGIAASMPDPTLRNRTESSARLVDAAVSRAEQLAPKVSSGCDSSSASDSLGPLPQAVCSSTPAVVGPLGGSTTSGVGGAAPSHSSGSGVGGGNAQSVQPASSASNGVQPTGSATSKGGGVTLPPLLPSSTTLPVNVGSCGVNASLGPIGIGIGLCSGVHLSLHP